MNKNYTKVVATVGALGLLLVSMESNSSIQELPHSKEEKPETYYVIDASFIDHSGSYEECVEYADYYKDNHDYVVVTAKDLARDIYE